jgi:hypothetical protein
MGSSKRLRIKTMKIKMSHKYFFGLFISLSLSRKAELIFKKTPPSTIATRRSLMKAMFNHFFLKELSRRLAQVENTRLEKVREPSRVEGQWPANTWP